MKPRLAVSKRGRRGSGGGPAAPVVHDRPSRVWQVLLSLGLLSPALTCSHLRSPSLTLAHLRSPSPTFAQVLLSLGLLGGSLCAAFVVALAGAWGVCEALGQDGGEALDRPLREAPQFYATYTLVVLGGGVLLLGGVNVVTLNVYIEVRAGGGNQRRSQEIRARSCGPCNAHHHSSVPHHVQVALAHLLPRRFGGKPVRSAIVQVV